MVAVGHRSDGGVCTCGIGEGFSWGFPYRFLPEISPGGGQIGHSRGKTLPLL